MARHKKELEKKLATQTPRVGTQNATVQRDDKDTKSVTSISPKANGIPSREELLKLLGYQGMNIALGNAKSNGEYEGILKIISMFNQGPDKSKPAPLRLCNWKLYLDSCTTYQSVFAGWCLNNVHEIEVYLKGHCNTGVILLIPTLWPLLLSLLLSLQHY